MPSTVQLDDALDALHALDAQDGLDALDIGIDVDEAFADLVLADDELVALEFDLLVASEFGDPPSSDAAPLDPSGGEPARPGPFVELVTVGIPTPDSTPGRRRNRQRGPPWAVVHT